MDVVDCELNVARVSEVDDGGENMAGHVLYFDHILSALHPIVGEHGCEVRAHGGED